MSIRIEDLNQIDFADVADVAAGALAPMPDARRIQAPNSPAISR